MAGNLLTCTTQGQSISVGASHTAVTGNTVVQGDGNTEILISGPVSGVSVQNNVVAQPDPRFGCGAGSTGRVGIGVDAT